MLNRLGAPQLLKQLAETQQLQANKTAQRLIEHPKMTKVWSYLKGQGDLQVREDARAFQTRLDALDDLYRPAMLEVETHDCDLAEIACGSIFLAASLETQINNQPVMGNLIRKSTGQWREAALQCTWAANDPMGGLSNEKLRDALVMVSEYFDNLATEVEEHQYSNPYYIDRSGKSQAEDGIRVKVLSLNRFTRAIYGSSYMGQLATIVSICCETSVEVDTVRGWIRGSIRPRGEGRD
ncbi:hypothetical protein [Labrys monachus]|uniref:Uncharacterized protein n=1 Tax=Labrys monachus TaxID=217067 RepID=A0ABU0FKR0_9HYPH|nr:hypothetical protein [Labrys monachus]MDQ0395197.1 hypothetical protein [Labrys monachus]